MRKFLILFIVSAYLLSTTELVQLLKVPVLISHYLEHKENNQKTTVWDYLVHHYKGHGIDEDWETDMRLPFMRHSEILQVLVVPPNNMLKLPRKNWHFSLGNHNHTYKEKFNPHSPAESIWQPPKIS